MTEPLKAGLDGAAFLAFIGWLSGILPIVATLFTAVWTGLRVYEAILDVQYKRKRNKDT